MNVQNAIGSLNENAVWKNIQTHKEPMQEFKCYHCTYVTKHKHVLIKHFLIHKSLKERQQVQLMRICGNQQIKLDTAFRCT